MSDTDQHIDPFDWGPTDLDAPVIPEHVNSLGVVSSPRNLDSIIVKTSPRNLTNLQAVSSPLDPVVQVRINTSPQNLVSVRVDTEPPDMVEDVQVGVSPKEVESIEAETSPRNLTSVDAQYDPKAAESLSVAVDPYVIESVTAETSPQNLPEVSVIDFYKEDPILGLWKLSDLATEYLILLDAYQFTLPDDELDFPDGTKNEILKILNEYTQEGLYSSTDYLETHSALIARDPVNQVFDKTDKDALWSYVQFGSSFEYHSYQLYREQVRPPLPVHHVKFMNYGIPVDSVTVIAPPRAVGSMEVALLTEDITSVTVETSPRNLASLSLIATPVAPTSIASGILPEAVDGLIVLSSPSPVSVSIKTSPRALESVSVKSDSVGPSEISVVSSPRSVTSLDVLATPASLNSVAAEFSPTQVVEVASGVLPNPIFIFLLESTPALITEVQVTDSAPDAVAEMSAGVLPYPVDFFDATDSPPNGVGRVSAVFDCHVDTVEVEATPANVESLTYDLVPVAPYLTFVQETDDVAPVALLINTSPRRLLRFEIETFLNPVDSLEVQATPAKATDLEVDAFLEPVASVEVAAIPRKVASITSEVVAPSIPYAPTSMSGNATPRAPAFVDNRFGQLTQSVSLVSVDNLSGAPAAPQSANITGIFKITDTLPVDFVRVETSPHQAASVSIANLSEIPESPKHVFAASIILPEIKAPLVIDVRSSPKAPAFANIETEIPNAPRYLFITGVNGGITVINKFAPDPVGQVEVVDLSATAPVAVDSLEVQTGPRKPVVLLSTEIQSVPEAPQSLELITSPKPPKSLTETVSFTVAPIKLIPAGTFTMGTDENTSSFSDRDLIHQVRLTYNFHITTTCVTQDQYFQIMGRNPSPENSTISDDLVESFGLDSNTIEYRSETRNLPVTNLSYFDAKQYCERLTEYMVRFGYMSDGLEFRLPREAEWERAARLGNTSRYAWGNQMVFDYVHARDPDPTVKHYEQKTYLRPYADVDGGDGYASFNGLYHMHGNVSEWCSDGLEPYINTYNNALQRYEDPWNKSRTSGFVIRGGNFLEVATNENVDLISAGRMSSVDSRSTIGFRMVLDLVRYVPEAVNIVTAEADGKTNPVLDLKVSDLNIPSVTVESFISETDQGNLIKERFTVKYENSEYVYEDAEGNEIEVSTYPFFKGRNYSFVSANLPENHRLTLFSQFQKEAENTVPYPSHYDTDYPSWSAFHQPSLYSENSPLSLIYGDRKGLKPLSAAEDGITISSDIDPNVDTSRYGIDRLIDGKFPKDGWRSTWTAWYGAGSHTSNPVITLNLNGQKEVKFVNVVYQPFATLTPIEAIFIRAKHQVLDEYNLVATGYTFVDWPVNILEQYVVACIEIPEGTITEEIQISFDLGSGWGLQLGEIQACVESDNAELVLRIPENYDPSIENETLVCWDGLQKGSLPTHENGVVRILGPIDYQDPPAPVESLEAASIIDGGASLTTLELASVDENTSPPWLFKSENGTIINLADFPFQAGNTYKIKGTFTNPDKVFSIFYKAHSGESDWTKIDNVPGYSIDSYLVAGTEIEFTIGDAFDPSVNLLSFQDLVTTTDISPLTVNNPSTANGGGSGTENPDGTTDGGSSGNDPVTPLLISVSGTPADVDYLLINTSPIPVSSVALKVGVPPAAVTSLEVALEPKAPESCEANSSPLAPDSCSVELLILTPEAPSFLMVEFEYNPYVAQPAYPVFSLQVDSVPHIPITPKSISAETNLDHLQYSLSVTGSPEDGIVLTSENSPQNPAVDVASDFCVSGWFYFDDLSKVNKIGLFNIGDKTTSTSGSLEIFIANQGQVIGKQVGYNDLSSLERNASQSAITQAINGWTHIAVNVFKTSKNVLVYVNGDLVLDDQHEIIGFGDEISMLDFSENLNSASLKVSELAIWENTTFSPATITELSSNPRDYLDTYGNYFQTTQLKRWYRFGDDDEGTATVGKISDHLDSNAVPYFRLISGVEPSRKELDNAPLDLLHRAPVVGDIAYGYSDDPKDYLQSNSLKILVHNEYYRVWKVEAVGDTYVCSLQDRKGAAYTTITVDNYGRFVGESDKQFGAWVILEEPPAYLPEGPTSISVDYFS